MARKQIARDQIVKLIVGAGQASPSPPVGPALGSKGVKSMDFCKVRGVKTPLRKVPPHLLLGIQCAYCPHDTWCPNTCPSDRSSRPILSFRTSYTNNVLSTLTSSWRQGTEEQNKRCYAARERKYWGCFFEAYLRYSEDQELRVEIIRTEFARTVQERYCTGTVDWHHCRTIAISRRIICLLYGCCFHIPLASMYILYQAQCLIPKSLQL